MRSHALILLGVAAVGALVAPAAATEMPLYVSVAPCGGASCSVTVSTSEWFTASVNPVGTTGTFEIDGPGTNDVTCAAPSACLYSTNAPGPFTVTATRLTGTSPFYFDYAYAP